MSSLVATTFLAAALLSVTGCGGRGAGAPAPARSVETEAATTTPVAEPAQPAAPTTTPEASLPTATSRPLDAWVAYTLPGGGVEGRLPQAPRTEALPGGGGTLTWAEWDGAGFAIATATAARPLADAALSQLVATTAAAVLDGLFGVEHGTVSAHDLSAVSAPSAAVNKGAWTTRAVRLEGTVMGKPFLALCRAHHTGARLVLHLLVVERSQLGDAEVFFDTLALH